MGTCRGMGFNLIPHFLAEFVACVFGYEFLLYPAIPGLDSWRVLRYGFHLKPAFLGWVVSVGRCFLPFLAEACFYLVWGRWSLASLAGEPCRLQWSTTDRGGGHCGCPSLPMLGGCRRLWGLAHANCTPFPKRRT